MRGIFIAFISCISVNDYLTASFNTLVMHKTFYSPLWCIAACTVMLSCSSTERVNTLSKTCIEGLTAAEDLSFSFGAYCYNKTFFSNKVQLTMADVQGIPVAKLQLLDECSTASAIDSQAAVLKTTLYAYFDGLQQLSANDLVQYNVSAITSNFSSSAFPNWNVDEKTVGAATGISNLLFKAIAGSYRNEKIKSYIKEGDESIGILIQKLVDYYDLLGVQITNNSSNIVNFYARYQSEASPYLQAQAQKDMTSQLQYMEGKANELRSIQNLLLKMATAHHEVNIKANSMSFKDWQQFISKESSEIFAASKSLYYLIQQNKAYATPKL